MANPGVGNKFLSVNLNKSYGQQGQHHHSNSYSNRTRANNLSGSSGGNGGGGMVVLSRPRSSQKAAPRLSVPPPLNLPSLRKEHEKFDSLGSGNGSAGAGVSGSGMRPSSSGMGWTKPVAAAALQEKDGLAFGGKSISDAMDQDAHGGMNKGRGAYQAPSRSGTAGLTMERSTVLRGEDFPSLRATLPSASGSIQKLKDGSYQKHKHVVAGEPMSTNQKDSHVDMRPQLLPSRHTFAENGNHNSGLASSHAIEPSRKHDDFLSGPLPLVRLNPRSDWADDERDTGHGLLDRVKDDGFLKSEDHWDGDFDIPKASSFPHKPGHGTMDRWGLRDNETGKFSSSEVPKAGSHCRDVRILSREGREGNSWRTQPFLAKEAAPMQETRNEARPSSSNVETKKDSKYMVSPLYDGLQNDYGRNNQGGKLPWNTSSREMYGNDHVYQSSIASKASIGSKGLNDSVPKFVKETRLISKSDKPYVEDPFIKDLGDGWDSFSGSHLGVVKRKKDLLKQTDFHDPVRESFEAELERVQKMQELERQRIIDEQERALDLARREEEERACLAREEEERWRRLEEEAREAAWKTEKERLEAIRKSEEQRITREEEKHRTFMEEERRKQAAKQKLLELEEKIAKRQSEGVRGDSNSSTANEKGSGLLKEIPRVADGGDWEDNEKMIDGITLPASSDSTMITRPLDIGSGSSFSRDGSVVVERGKTNNNWRRDALESSSSSAFVLQEQGSGQYDTRRESSFGGKTFSRKEYYGGGEFMSARAYNSGGVSEPQMDGFSHLRGNKWDFSDGDHYQKNTDVDSDISENLMNRYGGDAGWPQGRVHSNPYALYPEQYYQHSETDGSYTFGRSRYSMRQPRALPPPSLASMHKNSRRGEDEHLGPPSFLNNEVQCGTSSRTELTIAGKFDYIHHENMEEELLDSHHEKVERKSDQETAHRCDSQSSLSVSSAPDSPIHLSHDDLDDSGDYPVRSSTLETVDFLATENGAVIPSKAGEANVMTIPNSGSSGDDDAEWTLDNNAELQEQEEYDEYDEGLKEEDEGREVEDENILSKELEGIHLKDGSSAGMISSLGLGFSGNVEARVGSNDIEVSKRKEVGTFPVRNREEVEFFNNMNGHIAQSHLHTVSSPETTDRASDIVPRTEKGIQRVVIESSNVLHGSATSGNRDDIDNTCCGVPLSVPSATILTPQAVGHTVMSSASSVATQAEVPFKLQFGLFSGPSLIPTPVPAIQIGSIQMPLNLHPHVGTSLGSVRPSQTPLFQFGQLRYSPPIAPGVVSLAPKSISSVHSTVPPDVSINQRISRPMTLQSEQGASIVKLNSRPISSVSQPGLLPRPSNLPQGNTLPATGTTENPLMIQQASKSFSNSKDWERQAQTGIAPSQMVRQEKDIAGAKGQGRIASSRRKDYVFKVKDYTSKPSYTEYEPLTTDGSRYQRRPRRTIKRTEFRVRNVGAKRRITGSGSSNHLDLDDKSNVSGRNTTVFVRYGSRRAAFTEAVESENMVTDTANVQEMGSTKESFPKGQAGQQLRSTEGNLNMDASHEDVDAPLQRGIVRIFEQPGIEGPSDDDDFIEVRSKRQMLNDKREQREKEIKAKSRATKVSRRAPSLSNASGPGYTKSTSNRGETTRNSIHNDYSSEGRGLTEFDVSSGFNTGMASQPLAPIGTPAAKTEAEADIRSQTGMSLRAPSAAFASPTLQSIGPSLTLKDKNKAVDDVQTALHSWESSGINQQVMALTQSQLDEAMKPAKYESRVSIGEHSIAVSEHINPSSSILTNDMPFSSSVNSLLAGEKIQFGAVTSPTVLPPSSRSVSHGIGPSVSCQPNNQISQKLSGTDENDCTLFFEKEKLDESCVRLEDCEAAASAVAIAAAAISNDEIVGNALSTCSVSVSESKTFGAVDANRRPAAGDHQSSSSQSRRVEDPLNVSLPADLSVDTPPIPLWPHLTSSQSTSNQMLSHFPGGPPPSHFPFYDMNMNTMMGSPIFAFGPNEESGSTQLQKSSNSPGGAGPPPHVTWQQCHSVDSFYGPPAGFTGPFINPGGLPGGVQGPPHMVVYNHFAPVGGQFGQVGLSFMGTTFIPSGKQPDWKHNPSSSGEGGDVNMSIVSAQRNPINMPSPIHHIAAPPGSPLLPVASPVAMFDVSPFQPSGEMPVHHHSRWSPLPSSALQSISISMPMPMLQKAEAALPSSEYNSNSNSNVVPAAAETTTHSSSEPAAAAAAAAAANQLLPADELGLVEQPSSSSSSSTCVTTKITSPPETGGGGDHHVRNNTEGGFTAAYNSHHHHHHHQHQHYGNNYQGQRGAASQKNNNNSGSSSNTSSSEWSSQSHHRRGGGGFHQGRNHHSFQGVDKSSFPPSRVKQIYVAKQSSSSTRNQSTSSS